eukprot:COSAG01_NODE_1514_length_10054_cov_14.063586_2_plen_821_part_00
MATDPVALVGVSCRFPGSKDTAAFWELLTSGADAISRVPADRWHADELYDPNPGAPGKLVTKDGGFVGHIDLFDPELFGISSREAQLMDPRSRLLLEVALEALLHGSQQPSALDGSDTGVFVGASGASDYSKLVSLHGGASHGATEAASARVSHSFGLHGPSVSVDTSESSSLVAVSIACQSVRDEDCRLALAGGVSLIISPERSIYASKKGLLSPSGRCKAFSSTADGYVRGEGCGIYVLKTLADATAAHDLVLAQIRGATTAKDHANAGGADADFYAKLISDGLANASKSPSQVGFIEADACGDPTADITEAEAISAVFSRSPVVVGTVKPNIGHLEAAAGIASLIKTTLAVQHGRIPASLHAGSINPRCALQGLQFPTQVAAWSDAVSPRVAGVNSFGSSGTSAHVVVQQADARAAVPAKRPMHVVTISGREPEALVKMSEHYLRLFTDSEPGSVFDLAHAINTAQLHFEYRAAFVTRDLQHAAQTCGGFVTQVQQQGVEMWQACGGASVLTGIAHEEAIHAAFLFTDSTQGSDQVAQLFATEPSFAAAFVECDNAYETVAKSGYFSMFSSPISLTVAAKAGVQPRSNERHFKPFQFAVQYAMAQLWLSWGVQPAAVSGQGIGHIVAICVAGAVDVLQALQLVMGSIKYDKATFNDAVFCPLLGSETQELVSASDIRSMGWAEEPVKSRDAHLAHVASALKSLSMADLILEMSSVKGSDDLDAECAVVCCGTDWPSLMAAAAELFVHGCTVDFRHMDAAYTAQPVQLPACPMQKKRCWVGEEFEALRHTLETPGFSLTGADAANIASAARRTRVAAM